MTGTSFKKEILRKALQKNLENPGPGLRSLLSLLARGYSGGATIRNRCYDKGLLKPEILPAPVISIGNLVAGGTGKTPMTLHVASLLRKKGYRVAILSRGYQGGAEKQGGLVSNGEQMLMSPAMAGDEPFMMARTLPDVSVLVGRNRFESGKTAINRLHSNVLVLDDGFQHRKLHRQVDLLLLDYALPLGGGKMLPLGRLREPVSGVSRSTAVVFTRCEGKREIPPGVGELFEPQNKPVFYASHEPYLHAWVPSGKKTLEETPPLSGRERLTALSGKRIMAFSGLAENGNFIKTLREASCQIIDFSGFADHHAYSEDELKALGQEALQNKADLMVTTEKDFVKIPEDFSWPLNLGVVGIRISMGQDQEPFERFLLEHLRT